MNHHTESSSHTSHEGMRENHYARLAAMIGLSFIAMYILMYAMVNSLGNVYMNFNQVYMAALMAAPMVLIELALMKSMYRDKRRNTFWVGGAALVAVACFLFIREQIAIGDRQFLRSMIPHHASAILMCRKASVRDPEIRALCGGVISSQQREIDQMKAMLRNSTNQR